MADQMGRGRVFKTSWPPQTSDLGWYILKEELKIPSFLNESSFWGSLPSIWNSCLKSFLSGMESDGWFSYPSRLATRSSYRQMVHQWMVAVAASTWTTFCTIEVWNNHCFGHRMPSIIVQNKNGCLKNLMLIDLWSSCFIIHFRTISQIHERAQVHILKSIRTPSSKLLNVVNWVPVIAITQ